MGELPTTADSVLLGIIGFMKAAFGLRFAAGFFALAAGFFAAAFFIGDFLAGDFFAAGFFAAFLDFLAAIGESSNLMVTLGCYAHPALWRDSERMHKAKTPCQPF